MAQITANRISLGYEGKTVVSDVSFCVEKGDFFCILGENGAGKSTLLKALIGLHKPSSGSIRFGDEFKRKDTGYLPQQKDIQKDFPASAFEIVLSGCAGRCGLRPFYNKQEKAAAAAAMEAFGIANLAKACYRELSGGQQQRVLLARAFCAAKNMIFLDEPDAGLDPQAAQHMYRLLASRNREDGLTVIVVSHDIESALRYATRILKIGGKANFFGTKEAYLERQHTDNQLAECKRI